MANTTVYFGNLPYETTDAELRTLLTGYTVKSVKLINDRDTGRPKGFGFIEFATEPEAEKVVMAFDGTQLGGRTLKVSYAHQKKPQQRNDDTRRNRR